MCLSLFSVIYYTILFTELYYIWPISHNLYSVCTVYIGIDAIISNINCSPLEGTMLIATKPPLVVMKPKPPVITNDIKISDLSTDKCSLKALQKYFSNKKKSGINTYKEIEIINKTTAILKLHDERGKKNSVIQMAIPFYSYSYMY